MVVLLEGSLISTEELWSSVRVTIGFLVTSLTKALVPQLLSLASSRKGLGGSKLLPFKNDEGHCVLGDLQCCRHFWVPFLRSVPRHNPVSQLYGQFLQPHGFVFALTCSVNCGTSYTVLAKSFENDTNINFHKVCCFSVFRYFCQMLLWNTEV